MLKNFAVVFFVVIFIAVIVCLIRGLGTKKSGGGNDNLKVTDRETDELCKTLTAEELYERACKLVGKYNIPTDFYRWKNFMRTAAEKDYTPAVREWGIHQKNKDNALAVQLLTRAADKGDGKALEELYKLYYYGSHSGAPEIKKDTEKAVSIIKPYAENGNAVAQRLLGNYYYYEKDSNKKALEWYLKAADGGDAEAMVEAADIYAFKDDVESEKKMLLKAAELNYADAEINLAICYQSYERDDETYDYEQAMYWYKRAYEHGSANAASHVGEMYLNGEGVTKDEKQAFDWFKKAHEKGSVYGTYLCGKCYMEGTGVAQDKKKGIKLYTRVERFESRAQYALGLCYLEGDGVKKNLKTAVDYLKKAARKEATYDNVASKDAEYKLFELYRSGVINEDDL